MAGLAQYLLFKKICWVGNNRLLRNQYDSYKVFQFNACERAANQGSLRETLLMLTCIYELDSNIIRTAKIPHNCMIRFLTKKKTLDNCRYRFTDRTRQNFTAGTNSEVLLQTGVVSIFLTVCFKKICFVYGHPSKKALFVCSQWFFAF